MKPTVDCGEKVDRWLDDLRLRRRVNRWLTHELLRLGGEPCPEVDSWSFEDFDSMTLEEVQGHVILRRLELMPDHSYTEIANSLGVDRRTLHRRRKELGVD